MLRSNCLFAFALLTPLLSAQQGHEIFQSNGGERVGLLNDPSVGGTVGSPDMNGDLFYKGLPEFATVHPTNQLNLVSIENLFIATLDWPTAVANGGPELYDLGISATSASVSGEHLVPDFFTTGSLSALISFGPSGLPHPCAVMPTSTCTSTASCPPGISGYTVDLNFGAPVPVGAAATDLTGTAAVWFLPGGMTFSSSGNLGSCGNGTYTFVGAQSVDEHQSHPLGLVGDSWTEGLQIGDPAGLNSTGPIPEFPTTLSDFGFGLAEAVLEPVIENTSVGTAFPPETGAGSLALDPSSGGVRLGARIVGDVNLAGSLVFTAASPALLPVPFTIVGVQLQLAPIGFFNATLSAWSATFPMVAIDADSDGILDQSETVTPRIPIPPTAFADVYMQAFIFPPSLPAVSSTAWRVRFQ